MSSIYDSKFTQISFTRNFKALLNYRWSSEFKNMFLTYGLGFISKSSIQNFIVLSQLKNISEISQKPNKFSTSTSSKN